MRWLKSRRAERAAKIINVIWVANRLWGLGLGLFLLTLGRTFWSSFIELERFWHVIAALSVLVMAAAALRTWGQFSEAVVSAQRVPPLDRQKPYRFAIRNWRTSATFTATCFWLIDGMRSDTYTPIELGWDRRDDPSLFLHKRGEPGYLNVVYVSADATTAYPWDRHMNLPADLDHAIHKKVDDAEHPAKLIVVMQRSDPPRQEQVTLGFESGVPKVEKINLSFTHKSDHVS